MDSVPHMLESPTDTLEDDQMEANAKHIKDAGC